MKLLISELPVGSLTLKNVWLCRRWLRQKMRTTASQQMKCANIMLKNCRAVFLGSSSQNTAMSA